MSKKINFDIKTLRAKFTKFVPVLKRHASFAVILIVLVAYLFVVWRISQLAGAEPPEAANDAAALTIPKVDKNAIDQIQALEQSNTEVHSLFDSARKNPFQE